ncbi:MAG: hypothetical protein JW915_04600 [Chitinispirillaceae bacterium]|nr:hypothetical protein [Chitinispirillaceae bacterium]
MFSGTIQSSPQPDAYKNTRENAEPQVKNELSDEQKRQVQELKRRDQEVKAHEAAHVAAGGAYVRGGASYTYQSGPDGKRYAVGGEVSIDTSSVRGDPQATITKMETVRRAALAPADPSGQDRAVAAQASATAAEARKELLTQKNGNGKGAPSEEKPAEPAISSEKEVKRRSGAGNYNSDARFHPDENYSYNLKIYA